MSHTDQFEAALQTVEPSRSLEALALAFAVAGDTPESVLQRFEQFRTQLHIQQREQDEDVVLDVMDRIVGWCHPSRKLFPNHTWR